MNNNQFRRLVLDTPARQGESGSTPRSGATPSALGTKKSSFIPMTPRTVKGGIDVDFARQVRERNAALQPKKKFKSSAAPKGSKLGTGYHDRTQDRADEEADERAARVRALEEQMKLGQIPEETFYALRDQITGGDASATHLVKGLDRQLLERVRRGEDVLGVSGDRKDVDPLPDVDDEFAKLESQDVHTVKKEKTGKKGSMAPPPVAGVKRSRDEIMAELKASRKAAAEAKAKSNALSDARFRKVGEKQSSRIERDNKGREVLITIDEDGVEKRKVRKVNAADMKDEVALAMPDESKPVLGADVAVPEQEKAREPEDEGDDIFEGVGASYNPLGDDLDDDDDDESDADDKEEKPRQREDVKDQTREEQRVVPDDVSEELEVPIEPSDEPPDAMPPPPRPTSTATRNYFKSASATESEEDRANPLANIVDVLKKAARLDPLNAAAKDADESDEAKEARLKKRAAMLANHDRDAEDMDLGFGSSRYGDDEGEDGAKVKLAEWKDGKDGWEEEDGGKSGGKKRKPKKRKGDANSMADIMRVVEGRKSGGK